MGLVWNGKAKIVKVRFVDEPYGIVITTAKHMPIEEAFIPITQNCSNNLNCDKCYINKRKCVVYESIKKHQ